MSVARDVAACLQEDLAVNEALARGVVNLRALARWLIATRGWEASEDAVLSALRRHAAANPAARFTGARALLAGAHLNVRSRICTLVVPKSRAVQDRLPSLFKVIDYDKGDTLRIIQGERGLKIFVDQANLARVKRALGEGGVLETHTGIPELDIVVPPSTRSTLGFLALVFDTLALRRVNVLDAVSGVPEMLVFVAEEDAMRAYQALHDLVRASAAPATA